MRQPFFGEIKNKKMILSDMGRICYDEWIKTTAIRKNIILDAFIIMPDHSHFLVVIKNDGNDGQGNGERNNVSRRDEAEPRLYTTGIPMNNEQTIHHLSPADDWITIHNQNQPISHFQRISPKPKSLPTIIGAYKSFCTRRIRNLGYTNFMWQERYHDSIIKDKEGVFRVREYIKNNPKKWHK